MNIFYNKCTQTKFHCALSKIAKQKLKRQQQSRVTHIFDEKKNIRKIAFSKYVNGFGVFLNSRKIVRTVWMATVGAFDNCMHQVAFVHIISCDTMPFFNNKNKKEKSKNCIRFDTLLFLRKKYLIEAQKKRYWLHISITVISSCLQSLFMNLMRNTCDPAFHSMLLFDGVCVFFFTNIAYKIMFIYVH